MTTVQGLDVSNFQGAFNWQAQAGKIGFGMAKATEGDRFTDAWFGHNWAGMLALNRMMPRFAYHFFHPGQDPVVQAAHLVATVSGHGLMTGDHFVLDLETSDGHIPAVVAEQAATCLHHVNALAPGHRVLVYTNPSFAKAGNCAGLSSWALWLASYGVPAPVAPPPWQRVTFWQYSENPLDADRYMGTEAELLTFTRMPGTR